MVATTLRTFLLETPKTISSVEVLGSWDNFTQPYPLDRDRGLGRGHWRGCHAFPNVSQRIRTVGLNMGGTYWYYYRFDGDLEYHDPVEPSTTACPLMPGQHVNILEVPLDQDDSCKNTTTSLTTYHWTLDPKEKYAPTKPYDQAKHTKRTSDASAMASFHEAWVKRSSEGKMSRSGGSRADAPRSRGRQLSSKGFIEGVKKRAASLRPSSLNVALPRTSGGSRSDPGPEQKNTLFSKSKRLLRSAKGTDLAGKSLSMFYKHQSKSTPHHDQGYNQQHVPPVPNDAKLQAEQLRAPVNTRNGAPSNTIYVEDVPPLPSPPRSSISACPPLPSAESALGDANTHQQSLTSIEDGHNLTLDQVLSQQVPPESIPAQQQRSHQPSPERNAPYGAAYRQLHGKPPPLDLAAQSNTVSPDIPPSFTYTNTLSPCRLSQPSQPITPPALRALDEDDFSWIRPDSETLSPSLPPPPAPPAKDPNPLLPTSQNLNNTCTPHPLFTTTTTKTTSNHSPTISTTATAGFQGYSLDLADQTSALTLKQLSASSPTISNESRHQYVHAWNEGQEQYLSGQQQLVREMGYLGGVIT